MKRAAVGFRHILLIVRLIPIVKLDVEWIAFDDHQESTPFLVLGRRIPDIQYLGRQLVGRDVVDQVIGQFLECRSIDPRPLRLNVQHDLLTIPIHFLRELGGNGFELLTQLRLKVALHLPPRFSL